MGSVLFDFGSEQKFTVVTLEPVTLVFRPKMDASLVFCLSQTFCSLSEPDRELTWAELL